MSRVFNPISHGGPFLATMLSSSILPQFSFEMQLFKIVYISTPAMAELGQAQAQLVSTILSLINRCMNSCWLYVRIS